MSELRPCPFCGGGSTVFYGPQRENYVRCSACKVRTGGDTSGEAAVMVWNRRSSAALEAENKALREALEGLLHFEIAHVGPYAGQKVIAARALLAKNENNA